jgi:PIN domain nuclease of toxin-antitoxin system
VRALLDTHTLLWWRLNDKRLSRTALEIIADGNNELFFSAASVWEIVIKHAKGKLDLPDPPDRLIPIIMRQDGIEPLSIELRHTLQVSGLPRLHDDPFDRLLVAQSQLEHLPILTSDRHIARYDAEVIW